jgi:hypothetical protein
VTWEALQQQLAQFEQSEGVLQGAHESAAHPQVVHEPA